MNKGDYVVATKWSDGDFQDHWCVGFFDHMLGDRYMIVDSGGEQFRGNGFRRCEKITQDCGEKLLLLQSNPHATPSESVWWFKELYTNERKDPTSPKESSDE